MRRAHAALLLVAALVATGCFRKPKAKTASGAPEEAPGPKAFAINEPLVPVRAEPVTLTWSPSTNATAYDVAVASDAACSASFAHQLGVVEPKITVAGLAEGAWYVCVKAHDDAGLERAADNDGAGFAVDRTAPTASATSLPSALDATAQIRVGGDGVVAYVYKAGPAATTDCAADTGYGNVLGVQDPLPLTVTGTAQDWVLCILGQDAAGNRQPRSAAFRYQWPADPLGRSFTLDVGAVVGDASLVGGATLRLTGTARNGWTTGRGLSVMVRERALERCLSAASGAFDAACPTYLPVAGTTSFTLDLAKASLTEGAVYDVAIRAEDPAVAAAFDAGGTTFAWRYGTTIIKGSKRRQVLDTAARGDGDLVVAGIVDGQLDLGRLKVKAAATDAGWDWWVARLAPDGGARWGVRFDGAGQDHLAQVAVDASGDVFVFGRFETDLALGASSFATHGKFDLALAKLDGATGAVRWAKQLGSDDEERAGGMRLDATGAPIVYGTHCGPLDFGDGTTVTPAGCNAFVATYASADGALTWAKTFAANGWINPSALARDAAGHLAVAGSHYGTMTFGATSLTTGGGSDEDGFVALLDATGNAVWAKALAGVSRQTLTGVALDASGNVLVSGLTTVTATTLGGFAVSGVAGSDTLVAAKLAAADGAPQWVRTAVTASDGGDSYDVAAGRGGDAYVLWSFATELQVDGGSVASVGKKDWWFARFAAADGATVQSLALGSPADDNSASPKLAIDAATDEMTTGLSYWGAVPFGDTSIADPTYEGALVLRFRP
jgi:hypothetical protein